MTANATAPKKNKGIFPRSKIIFYLVAVIFFGLVIYFVTSHKKDIRLLVKVDVPWLLLAIVSELATYIVAALIYRQLLKIFMPGNGISLWQLTKASNVALFTDQVIPSGGISGNGFIFNFLVKKRVKSTDSFSVVVLQLLTYYTAVEIMIVVVAIIAAWVFHLPQTFFLVLGAGFIGFLVFAILVSFIGKKETMEKIGRKIAGIKFLAKFFKSFSRRFSSENMPAAMSNPWVYFLKHPLTIATVLLLQIGVYGIDGVTIYALFKGLGVDVSLMVAFIAYLLTRIISLLPVSPGSLILYESGMTFFFTQMGMPLGASISVTLLFRLISFWMPMPIGFVLYRKLTTS